jgi:hypothetical protein
MLFGSEFGIKVVIFTHTACDFFNGYGLNAMVNELDVFLLGLVFIERRYMIRGGALLVRAE